MAAGTINRRPDQFNNNSSVKSGDYEKIAEQLKNDLESYKKSSIQLIKNIEQLRRNVGLESFMDEKGKVKGVKVAEYDGEKRLNEVKEKLEELLGATENTPPVDDSKFIEELIKKMKQDRDSIPASDQNLNDIAVATLEELQKRLEAVQETNVQKDFIEKAIESFESDDLFTTRYQNIYNQANEIIAKEQAKNQELLAIARKLSQNAKTDQATIKTLRSELAKLSKNKVLDDLTEKLKKADAVSWLKPEEKKAIEDKYAGKKSSQDLLSQETEIILKAYDVLTKEVARLKQENKNLKDKKDKLEESMKVLLKHSTFSDIALHIIRTEFDEKGYNNLIKTNKNDKGIEFRSLGLYLAVKQSTKDKKYDEIVKASAETFKTIYESLDFKDENGKDAKKEEFLNELGLDKNPETEEEFENCIKTIINNNQSKIKKTNKVLKIAVVSALAVATVGCIVLGLTAKDNQELKNTIPKIEEDLTVAQKNNLIAEMSGSIAGGTVHVQNANKDYIDAVSHKDAFNQAQDDGVMVKLLANQESDYDRSFNTITTTKGSVDQIAVLDRNGNVVGGSLYNSFEEYKTAVQNSNTELIASSKTKIEADVSNLAIYAETINSNYENMLTYSNNMDSQEIQDLIIRNNELEQEKAELEKENEDLAEEVGKYQVIEINELNTDTATYTEFINAFTGGKGSIINIRISYQNNGVVTVTFDTLSNRGEMTKDNIKTYEIKEGLAEPNAILSMITDEIEAEAGVEM